jgi:hypothetical protein
MNSSPKLLFASSSSTANQEQANGMAKRETQ